MLNLSQLLRVPHVDSGLKFDISPDGQRLVFSWNKTGKWELYETSLRGRQPEAISEPVGGCFVGESTLLATTCQGSKFAPTFSPDGTRLAFALDLDGSESYQIVIHDFESNTSTNLTPRIAYAHQPNITWSADGQMLAVLSDKHGQFALHLLPVDGAPGRMIKNVFRPCWDAKWSPDGQWIAIEAESTASDRSIYVMPVNRPRKTGKGKATKVATTELKLNAQHPAWSPDSKFLAFSGERGEWHDIGLLNVETQEISWVNESIGDDTQPAWSRSGKLIGWVHAEGARTSFQFRNGSDPVKEIKVGDGVHYQPQFTSDSVVILYEDPSHPCDLWKINLEDDSIQQLTNSLPDELRDAEFVQPEEVLYAGMDGKQVPALLYRGSGNAAVVDIHGGPNWQYQFLWQPMISHMVSRGWTALAPNYRGSTGYGKKWQNASRYDMGGVDTDDCAAGVNYLLENRLAEKDKIAVTGRSHGGYLTMTCMTMYPELWAAGSAVVPFLNWIKSHKNSREDLQHWNIENMGYPEDNHELWVARSQYLFLDKVTAPVQMICG
ncbi:MAG: prolyl oligopeptidase family serine peptidase, partial [Anaerolineales bacterium]|nr:prolyl oligopeptidase family serine peptidase [Anaerolineales bacterium]